MSYTMDLVCQKWLILTTFVGTRAMKNPVPAPTPSAPPAPAQSATTPPPSRPAAARCPNPGEPCPSLPETSGHAHCPAYSPARRRRRRIICRTWTWPTPPLMPLKRRLWRIGDARWIVRSLLPPTGAECPQCPLHRRCRRPPHRLVPPPRPRHSSLRASVRSNFGPNIGGMAAQRPENSAAYSRRCRCRNRRRRWRRRRKSRQSRSTRKSTGRCALRSRVKTVFPNRRPGRPCPQRSTLFRIAWPLSQRRRNSLLKATGFLFPLHRKKSLLFHKLTLPLKGLVWNLTAPLRRPVAVCVIQENCRHANTV